MKPLILLIAAFAIYAGIAEITTGNWNLQFAGNLAMLIMLCFTALGHILFPKGMALMIPRFIVVQNSHADISYWVGLLFLDKVKYAHSQ
jgi:hypothetical protein